MCAIESNLTPFCSHFIECKPKSNIQNYKKGSAVDNTYCIWWNSFPICLTKKSCLIIYVVQICHSSAQRSPSCAHYFFKAACNKCQTLCKPWSDKQKCFVALVKSDGPKRSQVTIKPSSSSDSLLLFFLFFFSSLWLSLSVCLCVCVCFLCMFVCVSWVEEQKVSAGLACVGGLWDSPWKQLKSQGHFLNRSSHHTVQGLVIWLVLYLCIYLKIFVCVCVCSLNGKKTGCLHFNIHRVCVLISERVWFVTTFF